MHTVVDLVVKLCRLVQARHVRNSSRLAPDRRSILHVSLLRRPHPALVCGWSTCSEGLETDSRQVSNLLYFQRVWQGPGRHSERQVQTVQHPFLYETGVPGGDWYALWSVLTCSTSTCLWTCCFRSSLCSWLLNHVFCQPHSDLFLSWCFALYGLEERHIWFVLCFLLVLPSRFIVLHVYAHFDHYIMEFINIRDDHTTKLG